jgi:hypothetical protein
VQQIHAKPTKGINALIDANRLLRNGLATNPRNANDVPLDFLEGRPPMIRNCLPGPDGPC